MVVVVDFGNHRLVLWRLGDGTVWKQLGSQGKKPGQFNFPRAVAVTSTGALVVTDMHRVQVLTADGAVVCLLDPTEVAGVGRLCDNLTGVTVCASTDEILVTHGLFQPSCGGVDVVPSLQCAFFYVIILTHLLLIRVGLI